MILVSNQKIKYPVMEHEFASKDYLCCPSHDLCTKLYSHQGHKTIVILMTCLFKSHYHYFWEWTDKTTSWIYHSNVTFTPLIMMILAY